MGTHPFLVCSFFLFSIVCSYVEARQIPFRDGSPTLSKILKPVINEDIHAFVNGIMQNNSMKGLSMTVIRSDGETEFGSWGISTEYGDKVTPETLFGLASSSQIFTSAAWAILADDFDYGLNKTPLPHGVTTLHNPTSAAKFFSDVQCPSRKDRAITLLSKDVLCDVFSILPYSRMGHFLSKTEISPFNEQEDIAHIIGRSDSLGIFSIFGRMRNYILQMVTSQIITRYSGKSFPDFVQERIFNNLSMTSTTYMPMEAEETGLMSHSWTHDGRRIPFYNSKDTHYSQFGADGVITNAVDMAKWLKFLWNDGTDPDTNSTLISDASYHFVTSQRRFFNYGDGTVGRYTKAWKEHEMIHTITHFGSLPGASSLVVFYPKGAFGLALLANTDSLSELHSIFHRVMDQTFNLGPPDDLLREGLYPEFFEAKASSPGNSTTELPLAYYAGIYSNPGYGTFQLCSSQSDEYCTDVLNSFRVIDSAAPHGRDNIPQLLASWPRKGSTHLRLVHLSGNTFSSYASTLFVNGFGMDKSPFEVNNVEMFCSAFSIQDGFVVGLAMVECSDADPGDKTMNQWRNSTTNTIIAWFDKVA